MKRFFKYKKNIILTFALACMLFLGVGVTIPARKASAEKPDIYTVEGANFFNIDGDYSMELHLEVANGYDVSAFAVTKDLSMNGFRIDVLENVEDVALELHLICDTPSLGVLPDLTQLGDYYYSCSYLSQTVADRGRRIGLMFDDRFSTIAKNNSVLSVTSEYVSDGVQLCKFMFSSNSVNYIGDYAEGESFYIYNIGVYYGSDSQSYSPYYYSIDDGNSSDDGAYDDGYSDGYSDGYDRGYADGLKQSQYGLFNGARLETKLLMSDGSIGVPSSQYPLSGLYFNGGLIFTPLALWIEDSGVAGNQLRGVSISIYFDNPVLLDDTSLRAQGPTAAFSSAPTLSYENNLTSPSQFFFNDESNFYDLNISSPVQTSVVGLLNWEIIDYENLIGLALYDSSGSYWSGYGAGFQDGRDEGIGIATDSAYEEGKIIGEDIGFKKGLAQGMSGDPYGFGDFMYTFVDMPGRIMSNWLNFDFMGLNLMGLVTFLLSITLVAFVLKKVV